MSHDLASSVYSTLKAQQPISIAALAALLQTSPEQVRLALADLAADGIRVQADKTGAYSIVSKNALFTPTPTAAQPEQQGQQEAEPTSAAEPTAQPEQQAKPELTEQPDLTAAGLTEQAEQRATKAAQSHEAATDATAGVYTEHGDFLSSQERGLTPPEAQPDQPTAATDPSSTGAAEHREQAEQTATGAELAEQSPEKETEPHPLPAMAGAADNAAPEDVAQAASPATQAQASSPDLGVLIKQVEDAKNAALAPEKRAMGMMDHLNELRWRLMRCAIAVGIAFMLCWSFAEPLFGEIMRPLNAALPDHSKLIYTAPAEAFFTYMRVAFVASIFAASPFIFYQIWSFIAPGLYDEEKRYAIPVALISAFFFIGGGCFCYFGVLPIAFQFFMGFATDTIMPMPSLNESLDFVLKLMVAFGAIFEMPLFTFFLARMGLVTAHMMSSTRRYAILVIFIVAAILTPPDVMSQMLMAIPMLVLYELSILIARVFGRAKKKETEETDDKTAEESIKKENDQPTKGTAA
jgi:sec-independent protein translocase protein TatC